MKNNRCSIYGLLKDVYLQIIDIKKFEYYFVCVLYNMFLFKIKWLVDI